MPSQTTAYWDMLADVMGFKGGMPPGGLPAGQVRALGGGATPSMKAVEQMFRPLALGRQTQQMLGAEGVSLAPAKGVGAWASKYLGGLGTRAKGSGLGRTLKAHPTLSGIAAMIAIPLVINYLFGETGPGAMIGGMQGKETWQMQQMSQQAEAVKAQMSAQTLAQPSAQMLSMQALLPSAAQTMQQAIGQAMGVGAELELPEVRWE